MSWVWRALDRSTVRYPLQTKVGIAGVLTGVADWGVQRLVEEREGDVARTGRIMAWRMSIHTPVAHLWFNYLDKALGTGMGPRLVLKKVVLDQAIASPLVHLLFLPFMSLLEGATPSQAYQKLTTAYIPIMLTSYMYWPFVHLLTFGAVPLRHRVLFTSMAGMLWMSVLSSYNASAARSVGADVPEDAKLLAQS